jgi:hypothetical protein
MLSAHIDPEVLTRMDSKAPVVIVIAVILMGVALWVASAIRNAGGVPPEQAKALAEEAERECVLQGHRPRACPKMVGRHHRECLDSADRVNDGEGARIDDQSYLDCMLEAFGEPEEETAAGDTGPSGSTDLDAGNADADAETASGASDDADATDGETD